MLTLLQGGKERERGRSFDRTNNTKAHIPLGNNGPVDLANVIIIVNSYD